MKADSVTAFAGQFAGTDPDCTRGDLLTDDQAMFFESADGTVVLLGCAHAGVINTLHYITELTDNRPISAVMGGMHLLNASPERIDRTVESLRRFDVDLLGPSHCTGMAAITQLWMAFVGTSASNAQMFSGVSSAADRCGLSCRFSEHPSQMHRQEPGGEGRITLKTQEAGLLGLEALGSESLATRQLT